MEESFVDKLQTMLEAGLEHELGYAQHDSKNKKRKKTIISEYGDSEVQVPRDRKGEIEPIIVEKHL